MLSPAASGRENTEDGGNGDADVGLGYLRRRVHPPEPWLGNARVRARLVLGAASRHELLDTSADDGVTWTLAGKVGAAPAALLAGEQGLFVAASESIFASSDGSTWTRIHPR